MAYHIHIYICIYIYICIPIFRLATGCLLGAHQAAFVAPASQRQQGLAKAVAVKVAETFDAHSDGQQPPGKTRLFWD